MSPRILPSQITAPELFHDRRRVLSALGFGAAALATAPARAGASAAAALSPTATPTGRRARSGTPRFARNAAYRTTEPLTTFDDVTSYNNFYEFGPDKTDPKARAGSLRPEPWSVDFAGECELRGRLTLEDVLKPHALEERIYRFRCVEAWSMVVPWLGFPLADLIRRAKPTSRAKYVEFTTLLDPKQMPGQRTAMLDWPYVEGLRMDEAMHPLTLMVVGVYGQWLPNQNGAPLRLIVPWKYGFKSIKSIVRIRFVEREPRTTWNVMAPDEYGFYANVNPQVDHPRWSQARERRLGASLFAPRIDTLPFNGYAEAVASLYRGMDLRRYY
jgi:sulfoxide reductase catalytic subunit YedY